VILATQIKAPGKFFLIDFSAKQTVLYEVRTKEVHAEAPITII
jgi:hypothetical protein